MKNQGSRRMIPQTITILLCIYGKFTLAFSGLKLGAKTRQNSAIFSAATEAESVDHGYYSSQLVSNSAVATNSQSDYHLEEEAKVTLTRYLNGLVQATEQGSVDRQEMRDLESILLSVQMACKSISNLVNRAGINHLSARATAPNTSSYDPRSDSQIRLDLLSTDVLQNALRFTGKLRMISPVKSTNSSVKQETGDDSNSSSDEGSTACNNNDNTVDDDEEVVLNPSRDRDSSNIISLDDNKPSEHQPGVIIASGLDSKYVACLDPLDGSGNADAAICTATIFGVFANDEENPLKDKEELQQSVLKPGKTLCAAGYCLYSSATILVFSVGDGVHGFTLDPQLGEFVLTHPNIRIPKRGNIYSCNEANSEGWSDGVNRYLKALKTGQGQTGEKYTSRYVGSMVGDIHRTLMYGGIFLYPSDADRHPKGNLQLLYKSSPLGYLVEQAGGKCLTSGKADLLSAVPKKIHERAPCFIGSLDDIDELKDYLD